MPGYKHDGSGECMIHRGELARLKQRYLKDNPHEHKNYIQDYIIRETEDTLPPEGMEVNKLYKYIIDTYLDHMVTMSRRGSKPAWSRFFRWICREYDVVFRNPEDEVIIHYSLTDGITSVESNIPDWRGGIL